MAACVCFWAPGAPGRFLSISRVVRRGPNPPLAAGERGGHTCGMADSAPPATRRVFIEDVRGNNAYLRATWHPDTRVVVVSHWVGEVCTASTPISVNEAGKLINLLVTALEGAAHLPVPVQAAPPPSRARLSALLNWVRSRFPVGARLFALHSANSREVSETDQRQPRSA